MKHYCLQILVIVTNLVFPWPRRSTEWTLNRMGSRRLRSKVMEISRCHCLLQPSLHLLQILSSNLQIIQSFVTNIHFLQILLTIRTTSCWANCTVRESTDIHILNMIQTETWWLLVLLVIRTCDTFTCFYDATENTQISVVVVKFSSKIIKSFKRILCY